MESSRLISQTKSAQEDKSVLKIYKEIFTTPDIVLFLIYLGKCVFHVTY